MRKTLIAGIGIGLAVSLWVSLPSHSAAPTKKSQTVVETAPSFNKTQYPIDSAASLWVIVNKGQQLPANYVPADLTTPNVSLRLEKVDREMEVRADNAKAMEAMFVAAAREKVYFMLASGYRSYQDQVNVRQLYSQTETLAQVDASSARPGFSEHQTGLAADLEPADRTCEIQACFADTPEGKWLAANAYKYGYTIRYPKDKTTLTGYEYEPWHIRYVGIDLAAELHRTNQTIEQFFGLPTHADYSVSPYQLKP